MTCSGERRVRLGEVIEMAQRYRGWSRRELARSIGRDPTKLIPSTGLPRLDFLVELAGVLDWEVDDLVSHLWGGERDQIKPISDEDLPPNADFQKLDHLAKESHFSGDFERMIALARAARTKASSVIPAPSSLFLLFLAARHRRRRMTYGVRPNHGRIHHYFVRSSPGPNDQSRGIT